MLKHGVYITLVVSATLATLGFQHGTGWLDRVVQYHKTKFFNEIRDMAPVNINAEIRQKPEGYKDSRHWDYDSVIRLLTLIRESETAKPVHQVLRRMLRPSRRLMMSMKESMQRFPSLQNKHNNFYYDVDYTSEEDDAPPLPPIHGEEAVVVVSNPVEARLPSARISVNLLREILEARSRAARFMPTTTQIIPWMEFVKNRSLSSTEASTGGGSENVTTTVDTTDANETDTNSTGASDTTDTGESNDTTTESESDTTDETSSEGGNGTSDDDTETTEDETTTSQEP